MPAPVKESESERLQRMADDQARADGIDLPAPKEPAAETPEEEAARLDAEAQAQAEADAKAAEEAEAKAEEERRANAAKADPVQKRFDELTARIHAQERELETLRKTPAKADAGKTEYSDDQLRQIARDYPEHKEAAEDMLLQRKIERSAQALLAKRDQESEAANVQRQASQTWTTLVEANPDLGKTDSELYQLANAEWKAMPNRESWPGAMAQAVRLAKATLLEKQTGSIKREKAIAEAARKKAITPLGGAARSSAGADKTTLAKLFEAANKSDSPDSPQWMAYLRAQAEADKAKAKPKEE